MNYHSGESTGNARLGQTTSDIWVHGKLSESLQSLSAFCIVTQSSHNCTQQLLLGENQRIIHDLLFLPISTIESRVS